MTDPIQIAFLDSIAREPDDDTTRLIYADWLTDRGDPRGDFIRIQCELATLDDWDPRRPLLEWQARALLDQNESEWRRGLPNIPGIRWGRFRRGFVDEIHIAEFPSHSNHLDRVRAAPTPVRRIVADSFSQRRSSPVLMFPQLQELVLALDDPDASLFDCVEPSTLENLRTLDLGGSALNDDELASVLAEIPSNNLESLSLNNTEAGTRTLELLADPSFESLRELGLAKLELGNGNTPEQFVGDVLQPLSLSGLFGRLERLTLFANGIDNDGLAVLLRSPYSGNLEQLDLRASKRTILTDIDTSNTRLQPRKLALGGTSAIRETHEPDEFPVDWGSPLFDRLESLSFDRFGLTESNFASLCDSTIPTRLREFSLKENPIGPSAAVHLSKSDWPHLHSLTLKECQLGASGLARIADWPSLTQLTVADLSGNCPKEQPGAGWHATGPFQNLLSLNLGSNYLRGEAWTDFTRENFPELRSLSLRWNFVRDEELLAFLESLDLPELRHLDLSKNNLRDLGLARLASLAEFSKLSSVYLDENFIGSPGIETLIDAPWATQLRTLHLANNHPTARSVLALMEAVSLDELQELNLSGCPFPLEALDSSRIDDYLPNLIRLRTEAAAHSKHARPNRELIQTRFGRHVDSSNPRPEVPERRRRFRRRLGPRRSWELR